MSDNSQNPDIDISYLAGLARIEIAPEEQERLASELGTILSYVKDIQEAGKVELPEEKPYLRNVLREDDNAYEPGTFKEKVLANAPETKNGYVKVKKIL